MDFKGETSCVKGPSLTRSTRLYIDMFVEIGFIVSPSSI